MSAITIDDELVHFEALGRGRPVVLVHGWLGSWRYWVPAMRQLGSKYRTYAIDLWGFGDSARDAKRYTFDAQVALLEAFMDRMGIKKAALVGHDFGASIAARYATKHPDRVARVLAVAPPLFHLAPQARPLTQNLSPQGQLPSGPTTTAAATVAAAAAAKAAETAEAAAGKSAETSTDEKPPAFSEAETMPWRNEEMKKRIQAALDRQAKAIAAHEGVGNAKSPQDAATPPTDQPAKAIEPATPGAPPEQLPDVPEMPKLDYVPGASTIRMMVQNPLKEQLKSTDRFKLLEDHVEDGPDRKKLRDEVNKADPLVVQMTIDTFGFVDTVRDLQKLEVPVLIIHGKDDTFL
ncbi:MAG: alpha/beta hydrolase, partial [Anaerolineae bacterium]|nr:alpha/beta hydrolase [Anaerolineae bacterium]